MQNHARLEGVTIELDGPFQTGTRGCTISPQMRQDWVLSEVVPEQRFVVSGRDGDFELNFAWDFEDEGEGTRLTQTITARGSEATLRAWSEVLEQMRATAPQAIEKLAVALAQSYGQ